MKSLDVKVWAVRKRDTKTPSYGVRWSVAGNVFSDSLSNSSPSRIARMSFVR